MTRRSWTDEQKLEIIKECDAAREDENLTVQEILKNHGISTGVLSTWRKKFGMRKEKQYTEKTKELDEYSGVVEAFMEDIESDPTFESLLPKVFELFPVTTRINKVIDCVNLILSEWED